MSKEQCRKNLEMASDVIQEMLEMLDTDNPEDGIQAFVEAYESATEYLLKAMRIAVVTAIPEPCFLDDDEPVEPPTHITRSKLPPSLHLPECPEKQAELTEQEQLEAQGQQRLIEGLQLDDIITIATHHVRDDDNFRVWCDCGEELHWNDDESLSDCNNCTPP